MVSVTVAIMFNVLVMFDPIPIIGFLTAVLVTVVLVTGTVAWFVLSFLDGRKKRTWPPGSTKQGTHQCLKGGKSPALTRARKGTRMPRAPNTVGSVFNEPYGRP